MQPNPLNQLKLDLLNIPGANKELFKRYQNLTNKIVRERGEEARANIEASAKAICEKKTPTRQEMTATSKKCDAATSPIQVLKEQDEAQQRDQQHSMRGQIKVEMNSTFPSSFDVNNSVKSSKKRRMMAQVEQPQQSDRNVDQIVQEDPSYLIEFKELSSQYFLENKENSGEISSHAEFKQANEMQVFHQDAFEVALIEQQNHCKNQTSQDACSPEIEEGKKNARSKNVKHFVDVGFMGDGQK